MTHPSPEPTEKESKASEAVVRFKNSKRIPQDEMDMTPMVDVTFLLLIFFMVTAAFQLQKSLEIPAPDESRPSTKAKTIPDYEDDPEYVVVRVDAYNTFHVIAAEEKEAPSEQELIVQLQDAKSSGIGNIIPNRLLVVADGEALHERVVMALDAGTRVGMEEVKLVTVEEGL